VPQLVATGVSSKTKAISLPGRLIEHSFVLIERRWTQFNQCLSSVSLSGRNAVK
jgi:hypothetical protein